MSSTTITGGIEQQSWVDKLLGTLDIILQAASTLLPGAAFADVLVKIMQKGAAAYESQTGKPIDPSLLKKIDLIP